MTYEEIQKEIDLRVTKIENNIHSNKIIESLYNNLTTLEKYIFIAMCLAEYIEDIEYYNVLLKLNLEEHQKDPYKLIIEDLRAFTKIKILHDDYRELVDTGKFVVNSTKLDIIFSILGAVNRSNELPTNPIEEYIMNTLYVFTVTNIDPEFNVDKTIKEFSEYIHSAI